MKAITTLVLAGFVVPLWLFLLSSLVYPVQARKVGRGTASTDEEETDVPKRLGRKKKKIEDKVYASYGLSPRSGTPHKVVEYSRAAVSAASSSAAVSASSSGGVKSKSKTQQQQQKTGSGSSGGGSNDVVGEPPAPNAQAKVDLRPYMSAVEDQRNSNSCAANAVAGAYEYLATRGALRDGEMEVGEISRLFIYYVGRKRDQQKWGENVYQKPKDEGMTLHGAIEAVQLKGAALQASWPFDLTYVNQRPPETAFVEAMNYKGKMVYLVFLAQTLYCIFAAS